MSHRSESTSARIARIPRRPRGCQDCPGSLTRCCPLLHLKASALCSATADRQLRCVERRIPHLVLAIPDVAERCSDGVSCRSVPTRKPFALVAQAAPDSIDRVIVMQKLVAMPAPSPSCRVDLPWGHTCRRHRRGIPSGAPSPRGRLGSCSLEAPGSTRSRASGIARNYGAASWMQWDAVDRYARVDA